MNNNEGFSAKDFATKLGCDHTTAYGFLKFLADQKIVQLCGKRKTGTGKGKPENLYSFVDGAKENFSNQINKIFV